jgi:hypothetical protein
MQYKFEFMLDEYVPPEYKDWHLEDKKRQAAEVITNALLKDCPFEQRDSNGRDIWGLEIVALPKKRYQQFIDSINSGLFNRESRAFILALVERMHDPWEEEG